MFVEAFGLRRDPFMDTADPSFYFETIGSANGRRRLTECLVAGRGLAAVVGPIGVGKTTLCNAVQQDVLRVPSCHAGLILDPAFDDERAFVQAIAAALSIDAGDGDVRAIKEGLKRALFASTTSGEQYVLFVDEAQLLPEGLLETLRALLNYQVDERKLLSVALSGQPELATSLARHPGLADRVALWLEIAPLRESEAAALLDHRLRMAGYAAAESPFEADAATLAWRMSAGLPRRLTVLAREAMEVAAERRSSSVSAADVEAARRRTPPFADLGRLAEPAAVVPAPQSPRPSGLRWPWTWLAR